MSATGVETGTSKLVLCVVLTLVLVPVGVAVGWWTHLHYHVTLHRIARETAQRLVEKNHAAIAIDSDDLGRAQNIVDASGRTAVGIAVFDRDTFGRYDAIPQRSVPLAGDTDIRNAVLWDIKGTDFADDRTVVIHVFDPAEEIASVTLLDRDGRPLEPVKSDHQSQIKMDGALRPNTYWLFTFDRRVDYPLIALVVWK